LRIEHLQGSAAGVDLVVMGKKVGGARRRSEELDLEKSAGTLR
jgi:hypothetical protein